MFSDYYFVYVHRYADNGCNGRVIVRTEGKVVEKTSGQHCHAADARELPVKETLNVLKEKAITTHNPIRHIVGEACASVDNEVIAAALPQTNAMARTGFRMRKTNADYPQNPESLFDLVLPEEFKKTLNGEDFVMHDTGPDQKRIIMFSTAKNIEFLRTADAWHIDGTFDVVPQLFYQLYTIHGE